MKVIAISGHDGSGKSTLAKNLAELCHKKGFVAGILPLARTLKTDLEAMNFPAFDKPTPPHLRELMRAYGMAARQQFGLNYWLDRWEEAAVESVLDVIIVDDMRHMNEYHWFLACGAHMITMKVDSTEPEAVPGLPPIIREIWDVRDAHAAGFRKASDYQSYVLDLATPDECDDRRLALIEQNFLNEVLLSGPKGDYKTSPRAAVASQDTQETEGVTAMPAQAAPAPHEASAPGVKVAYADEVPAHLLIDGQEAGECRGVTFTLGDRSVRVHIERVNLPRFFEPKNEPHDIILCQKGHPDVRIAMQSSRFERTAGLTSALIDVTALVANPSPSDPRFRALAYV